MTANVRKQVTIDRSQEELLKRMASQTGLSEAEIIRQALRHCLEAPGFPYLNDALWERELAFMQAVIDKGPVPGRRTWRRDDLYDDA